MIIGRFFHLDCHPVIPECGYHCGKCIGEIHSVIGSMPGVTDVSMSQRDGVSGIVVQFDSDAIAEEQLIAAFGRLPSFYQGRFVAKAVDA